MPWNGHIGDAFAGGRGSGARVRAVLVVLACAFVLAAFGFGQGALAEPSTGGYIQSADQGPFTIIWEYDDGTELSKQENVEKGTVPQYAGATPTKESTAQFNYTFAGWFDKEDVESKLIPELIPKDSNLPAAVKNTTYVAAYTSTTRTYTVTWKDHDDKVLWTEDVEYGTTPDYGANPTRWEDAGGQYTFSYWDPNPEPITGDTTYTAVYTQAPVEFQILSQGSSNQPIEGAVLTLTNSGGVLVWTSDPTTANGIVSIPRVEIESENCVGAEFKPGSTYILKQTATDEAHFLPQGTWTLQVNDEGKFSCTNTKNDSGDLSTIAPSDPYGIRIYLHNALASTVTYQYNYPAGVEGQPEDITSRLDFLAYDGSFTVEPEDPQLDGYEFAGWSYDNVTTFYKQGETATNVDTITKKNHTMTARWRIPLNVSAVSYTGDDEATATPIEGTQGTFAIEKEKTLSFTDVNAFAAQYAQQNTTMANLIKDPDYSYASAVIVSESGDTQKIANLHYDAAAPAWQYQTELSNTWIDIKQGDELILRYISNVAYIQWVERGENGSLTLLDAGKFPARKIDVALDGATASPHWQSTDKLLSEEDSPIVEGLCYYDALGFGPENAANISDLEQSGLASFEVANTASGLRLRTGSSGTGASVVGNTIYVIYTPEVPEQSAYLDIRNDSDYPYQVSELTVGTGSAAADALADGRVIVTSDELLRVLKPDDIVDAGKTMQLVLLKGGTSAFVLDGGFVESASAGTTVSVGISGSTSIARTALTKETAQDDILASTAGITKGTLEAAPGKVEVSFDSDLFDLSVKKEWKSDDIVPTYYEVDLALFEDGKACVTAEAARSGFYVVKNADGWNITIPNLPRRASYAVTEHAVRSVVSGTTEDITANFRAASSDLKWLNPEDGSILKDGSPLEDGSLPKDGLITVENTRINKVCRVGDVEFLTVKAAVDYIRENNLTTAIIEMLDDYIMAESAAVEIPVGYDITLTTATGESVKTITRGFSGTTDMFHVLGKLAIANVTLTGKLDKTTLAKEGDGGLVCVEGANARLDAGNGAKFTGAQANNGAALYAKDGATIALDGARIEGNKAVEGGAVGVSDATCRILLSGATYIYGNSRVDNGSQFNIYLDQDANDVIQVVGSGLTSAAAIGVYVANGTDSALYKAHGAPAQPFAIYESGVAANLNTLRNDRLSSGDSKYGFASTTLANTVVWGETFSFTVDVQWLDDRFNLASAPADAQVELKLYGGYATTGGAQTTVTVTAANSWKATFSGLAKYDGSGKLCEYTVSETSLPSDYKRVIFEGDRAVEGNPISFDKDTGDDQVAIVSNYYRYTTFTVNKTVAPADQGLRSTFAVYGVPKTGADLSSGAVRKGGVGSVSDLPIALRGGVAPANDIPQDGKFYTVKGGNIWVANIDSTEVTFHRFYDIAFGEFEMNGDGIGALASGDWQDGDVVRINDAGACKVRVGGVWQDIDAVAAVSYLQFSRQDGNGGVESVGGQSMGKSFAIVDSGSRTFTADDRLSADYYYYVVETAVQENNNQRRMISGTHKLVATYDPRYTYDQLNQVVDVTNTRQDYLSVDKIWPEDATSFGECDFDVYRIDASGSTVDYLKDPNYFEGLVTGGAGTKVGEFRLPEDTGSWVHVLKDLDPTAQDAVYFVRESSAGGVDIKNPYVSDSDTSVDAVYSFDEKINQITVHNMSDVLCKIDDSAGEHPFRTLNDALEYGRTRTTGDPNNVFTIQMLRDYSIPASDIMQLNAGEKITLTTASTTAGEYKYKGKDGVTRATITRKSGNTLPYIIMTGTVGASDNTSLTLENIAFDGGGGKLGGAINRVTYNNGGFVYAKNATVALQGADKSKGVEMRNQNASNGGAIYAEETAVTVTNAVFANCNSTGTSNNSGGGAIWTSGAGVTSVAGSSFAGCTAKRNGGAIASVNTAGQKTVVSSCTFTECTAGDNAGGNAGGVYTCSRVATIENSTFTKCSASYRGGGVFHDNFNGGQTTTLDNCTFTECTTVYGTDGQNERHGGGGVNSNANVFNASNCTFDNCTSHVRGGGLVHFNLGAAESNVINCTFNECTSEISGGGGMGLTGLNELVRGCSFTDCVAQVSAGGGLDVVCWDVNKDAVVEDCTFERCTAGNVTSGANGGGICFGGRTLTVRTSSFTDCTALKQHGGAIAVSAGGTMEALDVYGCTFERCSAENNEGGAIYTQGTALRVQKAENGTASSFTECTSKNAGGAIQHTRSVQGAEAIITDVLFSKCISTNSQGGALRTTAPVVELSRTAFEDCSSLGHGGSVYQTVASSFADDSSLAATSCTFVRSTAGSEKSGNGGGALYTEAKTLSVTGEKGTMTFDECSARSYGGAVYHNRSDRAGVSATFEDCTFSKCKTTTSFGGAICTVGSVLTLDTVSFDTCSSENSYGGAVYQGAPKTYIADSRTDVWDCTFVHTSAGNGAGALYTSAKELSILGKKRAVTFEDCTTVAKQAGAVWHDRYDIEGTSTTLNNCSFTDCVSQNDSIGALYTRAVVLSAQDVSFKRCVARNHSGALYQDVNSSYVNDSSARLVRCTFVDCESRNDIAGALRTSALVLSVEGEPGTATFENCKAAKDGGALHHDRSVTASETQLKACSFKNCSSTSNRGGAVFTRSTTVGITGGSSFKDCSSYNTGGAIFHQLGNNDQIATSTFTVDDTVFDTCSSSNASAGAIYTTAQAASFTGKRGTTTFVNCWCKGGYGGGAIYHDRNTEASRTDITLCSFDTCSADHPTSNANARGGALYTGATKLFVTSSSFAHTTARGSGGAIYQDCNEPYAASTEASIKDTTFEDTRSVYGAGGALWSDVQRFEAGGSAGLTSFTQTEAAYEGGAVYLWRNNAASTAEFAGCIFNTCTSMYATGSSSRGGAIFVRARDLKVTGGTFNDCTAKNDGGAIMHQPDTGGDIVALVEDTVFDGCASTVGGGGAFYSVRSQLTMNSVRISDCSAATDGGALYQSYNDTRSVVLDSCAFIGNEAANRGGAVFFDSNGSITLRNGTTITGNRIGNDTVENAAGIHLPQARGNATLVLGAEGLESDTLTVYGNLTRSGDQSNVRLIRSGTWSSIAQRYNDRETSVLLLSNLTKPGVGVRGTIGICNPGPENTRFGVGDVGGHTGSEYIESDIDTLHGKLDPADHERKRLIWYAPPVCKITDQNGWPLYYGDDKTAVFASLKEAFQAVNVTTPGYLRDGNGVTPAQIQIQMLVADYELEGDIPVLRRNITLATANAGPGEYDYPLDATSEYCTVVRGPKATGSMITVGSGAQLEVARITLDGGDRETRPYVVDADGGIIRAQTDAGVVLSTHAVLQNSAVAEGRSGGAVYVTGAISRTEPSLVMQRDAAIVGCEAGNGGGVFMTGGVRFEMNDAARIEGCSASRAGGAVYVSPNSTMAFADNPNPIIRGNRITDPSGEGAGIYLPNNSAKLQLQLGASAVFADNLVEGTQDARRTNGGEAYPLLRQDIFIGESGERATSIVLVGDMSLPEGSIWVWARNASHYKTEMQFAVVATDAAGNPLFVPRDSTLAVLRNAQDDAATENDTDGFLYGIAGEGADIIWSFSTGTSHVVLRKVADEAVSGAPLAGAVFNVYKGRGTSAYVLKHEDGTRETLSGLRSGSDGVFWVGDLPHGTYYLQETTVPAGYSASARWFKLVVDENGILVSPASATRA